MEGLLPPGLSDQSGHEGQKRKVEFTCEVGQFLLRYYVSELYMQLLSSVFL